MSQQILIMPLHRRWHDEKDNDFIHVAQVTGGVNRYIRMILKYLEKEKFENILVCSQDYYEENYRGLVDSFEQVEMTRVLGVTT